MAFFGPILALSIVFFSLQSGAMVCSGLFNSQRTNNPQKADVSRRDIHDYAAKLEIESRAVTSSSKNAGDALLGLFDMILNAPKGATVKIYTNALKFDGIGSLLLMTSIMESAQARGLKFEFRIQAEKQDSHFHDLIVKRSTNTMFFKEDSQIKESINHTLIVVEGASYSRFMHFAGELASTNLKDQAKKESLTVNYDGTNRLRASPFKRDITVVEGEGIAATTLMAMRNLDAGYTVRLNYTNENTREAQQREAIDLEGVRNRGWDLALQLYLHKYGKPPKNPMNTMGILSAAVKDQN